MPSPDAARLARVVICRHRSRLAIALAGATLASSGLQACAPGEQFAPACPQLGLLREAADLTQFRPSGKDVTDMILDGRITAIPAQCSAPDPATVVARVTVTMDLTRGPAAPTRALTVPYFVAVTDGDRVIDEQDYALAVAFPANTDRLSVSGQEVTLRFPVTPQRSAAAYKIYVGFRLTPEQLAVNRARGAR